MPGRKVPLVTGETYHIFNRGINHCPTFITKVEFKRAIAILTYYRFTVLPTKLSRFLKLATDERTKIMAELVKNNDRLVEIMAFCLMPNHFHFVLKQLVEGGISKFVGNFQNSYTRYFNTKNERDGSLFLDQFKAVRIETDEQLLHVLRYVHLNPYTSFIVKNFGELVSYPWSSLREYLTENHKGTCNQEFVKSYFKNKEAYKQHVLDQADYQRELHIIEHLVFE